MKSTLDARNSIVDFLHKELVGPSPGYPVVQLDGEEILRPQDPPRQRYAAGVLFPMRSGVFRQDATASDEEAPPDAESPERDPIVEGTQHTITATPSTVLGENPPDTDREVTLANEFLPSAMGLSALIEVPEILQVDVSAGVYLHKELQSKSRSGVDGRKSIPKGWWRRPIDCSVELLSEELLGTDTVTIEKPVYKENGQVALALHVVSRLHVDSVVSPLRD